MVALLVTGSAISLLSLAGCTGQAGPKTDVPGDEKIISRTVRDMEVTTSEDGLKQNLMRAPLVEEHAFAPDAYEEYPRGIEVVGYDSVGVAPASRVVADRALHWTARDLWQLSGNVIVEGDSGQRLYTQQLFWDRKTRKIWSNVDCRVEESGDVLYGTGFEAMDDFSQWRFRDMNGTVGVDVEPTPADSVAMEGSADPGSASGSAPAATGTGTAAAGADAAAPAETAAPAAPARTRRVRPRPESERTLRTSPGTEPGTEPASARTAPVERKPFVVSGDDAAPDAAPDGAPDAAPSGDSRDDDGDSATPQEPRP
ncbi:MAG: hypothetical protein LBU97_04340 [Alistipes sp.]|jgi:hypothetical protein|nr:hypothetical protein [Alistipes sp.]